MNMNKIVVLILILIFSFSININAEERNAYLLMGNSTIGVQIGNQYFLRGGYDLETTEYIGSIGMTFLEPKTSFGKLEVEGSIGYKEERFLQSAIRLPVSSNWKSTQILIGLRTYPKGRNTVILKYKF